MTSFLPYVSYFYSFYLVILALYPFFRFLSGMRGFLTLTIISLGSLLASLLSNFYNIVFLEQTLYLEFCTYTFHLNTIELALSLSLNLLGYLFFLLVTIIGFATNLYTLNYFKNEADESLFLFWLNSFIAGMSLLVLAGNFFTLFLGWELIGLTSFFLINFWTTRRATLKSSFKAFSFNLVSDIALLGAFINFYIVFGTTDITFFVALTEICGSSGVLNLKFGVLCLIVCASIKSVQIIGHLWLPDSMEAPVPASSLIHSATLVSAGVYLLLRFYTILELTDTLWIVLVLGSLTCAYGGVVAAVQTDMKKLLAYSTMSHCGFLYVTIYCGYFYITITYLFLHGLFKAATFYCVGSFVRSYRTQDIRWMGCGARIMPFDSIALIFCAINLGGLPFTIGYTYKYYLFKTLLLNEFTLGCFGFIIIGMLSSLGYVFRLIYYPNFDFWKGYYMVTLRTLNLLKSKQLTLWTSIYTPITVWALLILVSGAVCTQLYSYYLLQELLFLNNATLVNSMSYMLLISYYTLLYLPYIILFYSFYLFGLIHWVLIEGRVRFTKSFSLLLMLYFILVLFFFVLLNILL